MSVAANIEVEIDGEQYALDKIPDEGSKAVLLEKEKLLGAIDLKSLVDDLDRVGAFIRIAYNGVGAAGPKFTDQQIKIQRLGYDITKLCDKSALTVAKFKKTSSCVLADLQSTYEYLLDNMEDVAVETLSSISKLAGDMRTAALELNQEFEQAEKRVVVTLEDTQKARGDEAIRIQELEKKRQEMEAKKAHEMQLYNECQEKEREAESRRRDLEHQEDKAISEIGQDNIFKSLANGLTSRFLGVAIFSTDGPEKKAAALKEKRLEALEAEDNIRKQRYEALEQMTSFTAKIQQCSTEANMAECAVQALHEAVGALKHLSAVMLQAAQFWAQMEDHCRSLAESELRSRVETALQKFDDKKRLKLWTSKPFKRNAIQFYAGWKALFVVCNKYMEQIKLTQADLYKYIKENPTWDESRVKVKELAETFLKDLERDKAALMEKDLAAQEEMRALGPQVP